MRISNLYISNSENDEVTPKLLVKKLWPLAAVLVIFLLGADFIFDRYIIFANSWSNQSKVKRLLDDPNPNEIPVFGASVARSSFTPDSISPDCFNYGMGKALFDVTRVLMKVECEKDKDAPIIFEINPRTFIRNPETTINSSTFIPLLNHEVIENFMRESGVFNAHYMVPGMRYYGNYFNYAVGPLRRLRGDKRDNRGVMLEEKSQSQKDVEIFVQRLANLNSRRIELQDKFDDPNKVFSPEDEYALNSINAMVYFSVDTAYLEEFEGYLQGSKQRKFILVTVPTNPLLKESLPNFDEFVRFATDLADTHENAYYLDYSDFPTELDYYKDPTHFSAKGARIFSSAFAKDFEALTGIRQDGSRTLN